MMFIASFTQFMQIMFQFKTLWDRAPMQVKEVSM